MKFSDLFEKMEVLLNLILDSNLYIVFVLFVFGILLLKLANKVSDKKMCLIIYFFEILTLGFVIYEGREFLLKTFNKLIDNVFLNFYFPSIYVYLFIFVFSITVFVYTFLNRFISKVYKNITYTYFLIFNFIFILFLNVMSKNNINIFEKASLFTNNESLILLELSTLVFFIYLVIMSLVYFTNSIILIVEAKRTSSLSESKYNNELEIINPNVVEEVQNSNDTYMEKHAVSFQELVKSLDNISNPENKINLVPEFTTFSNSEINSNGFKFIDPVLVEEPFANDVIKTNVGQSINEKLNFIDFNILENKKNDSLTLNDYRLFSDMLKTVINNNDDSNLSMNDVLNKNLLNEYSYEEYSKFEKMLNSCMN